jgi:hypothetical protein
MQSIQEKLDRDFILTMNKLRNPLAHGGLFNENILAAFPVTPIPLASMMQSLQGKEIPQVIISMIFFVLGWSFTMFGLPELVRNIFNKKFKAYMFVIMNY